MIKQMQTMEICDCCGKFDRTTLFFFENGDMPKYVCNNCPSPDESSLLTMNANYPNIGLEVQTIQRSVAVWEGEELLYYLTVNQNGDVLLDNESVAKYCHLMPEQVTNAILEIL